MFIDETLAKSLAKNSLSKLDSDYMIAIKNFDLELSKVNVSKRTNFEKILRLHQDTFESMCYCYVRCGSNRKPYIGYIPMYNFISREYKVWSEASLIGMPIFKYLPNWEFDNSKTGVLFSVGQHALSRVFQRSGLVNSILEINNNLILSEFKYLSLWAAFWSKLLFESNCLDNLIYSEISILVPSPNGILLCELYKHQEINNLYNLEVRTFVNINQLSESQSKLRLQLIEVSYGLENTALSLYPYFNNLHQHECRMVEVIFIIVLHRIKKLTSSISFESCNKEIDAYKFKQLVDEFILLTIDNRDIEILDVELRDIGYEMLRKPLGNFLPYIDE